MILWENFWSERPDKIDKNHLHELADHWERKANKLGTAPSGSVTKAQVYEKCAKQLRRELENR